MRCGLEACVTSTRPYLLRALYEWIVDNNATPHLLVDARGEDAQVPRQYVQEGKIVLNVSPSAIQALNMDNAEVSFNARFGGQAMRVVVPVLRVLAIYARETGEGMMFSEDEPPPPGPQAAPEPGKPRLKVVK